MGVIIIMEKTYPEICRGKTGNARALLREIFDGLCCIDAKIPTNKRNLVKLSEILMIELAKIN